MARVGILFGLILCGLTVAGLVATDDKVPSQFVPMMLGIPVLFCGVVALNPHRRKQSMFVAGCIALVGTLGGITRLLMWLVHWIREGEYTHYAFNVSAALTVVSATLLVICAIWLNQDRRRRRVGTGSDANDPTRTRPAVKITPATKSDRSPDIRSREVV